MVLSYYIRYTPDGEVVDVFLQHRRDGNAAKRYFKRLLKTHSREPRKIKPISEWKTPGRRKFVTEYSWKHSKFEWLVRSYPGKDKKWTAAYVAGSRLPAKEGQQPKADIRDLYIAGNKKPALGGLKTGGML